MSTATTPHTVATSRVHLRLLLPLALLASIAPFATDLYLPAFPDMVTDLATTEAGVQLSLTGFLIGAAVGQVIFGPLSDRYGRVRPLYIGLIIAVIAGVATAIAPTDTFLVIARVVQGAAAAAGMVIGRAIITDVASGREAARALSMLMVVGGVAPVLAPIVGAVLSEPLGWRGLLWVVTALCLVALVLAVAVIRETNPRSEATATASPSRLRDLLRPLRTRAYLGNGAAFVFAFSLMMAYISASPFFYQDIIGLGEIAYAAAFAINAAGMVGVTWLAANLSSRVAPGALARVGLTITVTSAAILTVLAFTAVSPLILLVPLFCAIASLGLVFGNTTALALARVGKNSGTASAALGFVQFMMAGLVAPLVSISEESAVPMAVTMLVLAALATVSFLIGNRGATGEVE